MYLLDTDIIIDFMRNKDYSVELMDKIKQERLFVSVISVGEVLEGLYSRKARQKMEVFQSFISLVEVLNVGYEDVEVFAKVRARLREEGALLENFDLLIAASAIARNLVLVSNNKRHFERVRGLRVFGSYGVK